MGERQCPAARSATPGYCSCGGGRTALLSSSSSRCPRASSPLRSGRPPGVDSRCGQDNMTSWLRACGSVPLCLLLCCLAAPRAEASGAGEWRLIRANYIISQQLARILYLVKASLRNIGSSPAQRCSLRGVWRILTSSPLRLCHYHMCSERLWATTHSFFFRQLEQPPPLRPRVY